MKVADKQQMYGMLMRGCFGNTARQWDSLGSFLLSGYNGPCGLRSKRPGGLFLAHVRAEDVPTLVTQFPEGCIINEMQRDERIVLQGELCEAPEWELHYSRAKTHMRPALRTAGQHASGLAAKLLLRTAMDPSSYECLCELLDIHDSAVVEFSVYDRSAGVIPNRNTLFWEVRNY